MSASSHSRFPAFRQKRIPCDVPATLVSDGQGFAVRVLNVSHGGAELKGAYGQSVGASVVLHRGGRDFAATVRWTAGARVGLQWQDPANANAQAYWTRKVPKAPGW